MSGSGRRTFSSRLLLRLTATRSKSNVERARVRFASSLPTPVSSDSAETEALGALKQIPVPLAGNFLWYRLDHLLAASSGWRL
jgi:hypothetical protein